MKDIEVPMLEPVVDRTTLLFTQPLVDWLLRLVRHLPATQRFVVLTPLAKAIPTTPMVPLQRGAVAFLRVTYFLNVTQPATSAGTVQVILRWTDAALTVFQGAILNGTASKKLDMQTILIHADCSQPITYETAYSTSGTNPLLYQLDLVVEQLNG